MMSSVVMRLKYFALLETELQNKNFCDPPTCHPLPMYHINVNISTNAAGTMPETDTSVPVTAQPVVSYTATNVIPPIPLQSPEAEDRQTPLTPKIEAALNTDSILAQKGNGLCIHFQGCSHTRGRKNTNLTSYRVCHCLPFLQIRGGEKTAVWADQHYTLHSSIQCSAFFGNLRTSLTPCRDCI